MSSPPTKDGAPQAGAPSIPPDRKAGSEETDFHGSAEDSAPSAGSVPAALATAATLPGRPGGSAPAADPSPTESLTAEFGRYRILRTLGSGGMGSVYLAHDTQLDRDVALKVPRFGKGDGGSHVERFYREARAMATLRHPNLCGVHDVGQQDGLHFLTMDYVEGRDLADWLKDARAADSLDAVEIVRKVALALGEAHQAGIVHRDLKPSNVMIDRRGEPIVMDFGLARRDQKGEAEITQRGAIMGSPAYMPPEQIEGDPHAVGPTADVYSLGVMFYQLLCRRLPFEGAVLAVLAQVLTEEPKRPSLHRPGIDAGLEDICLRAMARRTEARYQSMRELVAALDAWRAAPAREKARARRREMAQRPAVVPGYRHDLFVCHFAGDDEPPPGSASAGWVSTLIDNLDWRLRQLSGERAGLSLWADDEPAAADARRLEQTAAALLVLSPGWASSEWNRNASGVLKLLGRHLAAESVFVVEMDRVTAGRPAELTALRSHPFWKLADRDTPTLLGYPRPKPDVDHEYYARLDDLARAVQRRLQALSGPAGAPVAAAATQAKPSQPVYLAEVTDDLDPLRDEVERYLTQYGFQVLPTNWYPRDPGEFRAAMEKDLAGCVMFVQLVGPFPGKRPPGGARSYAALQCDVAAQKGLPILQWREVSLDPAHVRDAEHAAFVNGRHVQAVELEEFKRDVVARAAQEVKRRTAEKAAPKPPADQAFVFINVGRDDLPLTGDLCGLLEQRGCSYALPMHEGRPDEIRQDLEANLLDCDGLIIVYGEITEQWVREQLRQWRKILYRRDKPLRALAVYEGPPCEKQGLGMRLPKMHVIDCRQGMQEDKVRSFLNELANG
ncbi:MAG TPA: serine/threonine-protein kinase [Gemmataceae bacterium]|nr:serine/threonine-protein kinase [Gemmataceae bacterium]